MYTVLIIALCICTFGTAVHDAASDADPVAAATLLAPHLLRLQTMLCAVLTECAPSRDTALTQVCVSLRVLGW